MAKKRTSPGKSAEAVLKEYNHRCSVCGADRPQLHHIDEDPANQDPLNLLPLCPNCHLSDQHNPTARVDSRLLRLFRRYKDPTILLPQFVPIFQRLVFLDDVSVLTINELKEKGNELIGFISQLEMGDFYASQIAQPLHMSWHGGIIVLPESPEEQWKREKQDSEHIEAYRRQVADSREHIQRLAIEMLRYQPWRCVNTQ